MALRALIVPGLVAPGPVQRVAVVHGILFGIQVEPALAALLPRPAVPGQPQALHVATRELDQILLQRIPAEGVANRVIVQSAVRSVGAFPPRRHDVVEPEAEMSAFTDNAVRYMASLRFLGGKVQGLRRAIGGQ